MPIDRPINDKEMANALALIALCDAAMEEQVIMNIHPPVPRSMMMRIVGAVLTEQQKQGVKLRPVTRPEITTNDYLLIVDAVMKREKELQGGNPKARRFQRQDAMRFVTTMLDTQASLAAGQPTTGTTIPPSEFDAQFAAVKTFIGAAITFMNYSAGQGLIYCPDEQDKPDHDHPAQPDTAMMKLWQAFGEPGEGYSDEKNDKLLTDAVTSLLGL